MRYGVSPIPQKNIPSLPSAPPCAPTDKSRTNTATRLFRKCVMGYTPWLQLQMINKEKYGYSDGLMTFFRFQKPDPAPGSGNSWDGMKPPKTTVSSIYSDLKWHSILYKNDNLCLSRRVLFYVLKTVQIISYSHGWKAGGQENQVTRK
jgi:hypothetical protein